MAPLDAFKCFNIMMNKYDAKYYFTCTTTRYIRKILKVRLNKKRQLSRYHNTIKTYTKTLKLNL